MKKKMMLALGMAAIAATSVTLAASRVNQAVMQDVPAVKAMAAQATIVSGVTASNTASVNIRGKALRALDNQWQQQVAIGKGPLLSKTMDNPLVQALKADIAKSDGRFVSALVMNNKGMNVAQTAVTQHYLQANRSVWHKPYRGSADTVYISRSYLDKQTGQRAVTISVPVLNQQHQAIGALAVNVDYNRLDLTAKGS